MVHCAEELKSYLMLLSSFKFCSETSSRSVSLQKKLSALGAQFNLALHFSCYKLMTFLMVLYVISMLMLPFSILSVLKHLICGINYN